MNVIEARDKYRYAFKPGAPYRTTASEAALAACELSYIGSSIEIPYEVFDNLGIDYDEDDESEID